jgi:hypothetical protein
MSRVADDKSRGVVVRSGRKQVQTLQLPLDGVIEGFDAGVTDKIETGIQYEFKSYKSTEKDSKRSLTEVVGLCKDDCVKDPNCAIFSANNPKKGNNKCYFGDKSAADSKTQRPDGRWTSGIIMRPEPGPVQETQTPGAPEELTDKVETGIQYQFKSYRNSEKDSKRSLTEVVGLCKDDCIKDPNCAIFSANNPKKGNNKCYFGDADAAQSKTQRPDGRWTSGLVTRPEPEPVDEGASQIFKGQKIDFKGYRTSKFGSKEGHDAVFAKCMDQCDADPKCRVVTANNPKKGDSVCYFGTEADMGGKKTTDGRWHSAVLPPKPTAEELEGKVQKGQKYDFKSYKKLSYSSKESHDAVTAKCAAACEEDPECRIMTANNPKNGSNVCYLGDAAALAANKITTDDRWNSATYGEKASPAGAPEMGYKYNFKSYKEGKKDSKRSLDEVIKLCRAECIADSKCAVVAAYNPKKGSNVCYFGDKNAADPNKLTKNKDDRWAGVLMDRTEKGDGPAKKPGDGQRYNFQAYKEKAYDAGRPLAEVLELCKKECVDDRKCRIVAAENTKVGANKCYFGDVVAMKNHVVVDDDNWLGAVVDEKPPRPPGVGQKYGFAPFRDVSYDPGRPIGEVLELCKKECVIDRKCRIVTVETPESGGPNKCYLGDEASFLKHSVTDDDRWMGATLPPKGPLPEGYQVKYDFKAYKTELVDSSLPLVEVHEKCKSMCLADDQCAVVATNDTLTGPYKCVFGNSDSVPGIKKTEDVNWISTLLPRKSNMLRPAYPGAVFNSDQGSDKGSKSEDSGRPGGKAGGRPLTEEEQLIAKYVAAGMTPEEAARQARLDLDNKTTLFGFEDGDPIEDMPLPYAKYGEGYFGMGVVLVLALFACAAAVLVFWMFCAWLGLGTPARA